MAYVAPSTRTTGALITAAIWNQDVVANPIALYAGAMSIASQAALDFIYASSATQLARLAKGTALQVPRINAAGNGWEFATITTKIVKVVAATYATKVQSSTSTYVDTGLTATITPGSASNTILVLVSQNGCGKQSGDTGIKMQLQRDGSSISQLAAETADTGSTAYNDIGSISGIYLDSPASVAALVYKTQFASHANIDFAWVQNNAERSGIALIEIAP